MTKDYLVFDIETPDLHPNEIHMLSVYDLLTEETKSYVGLDEVAIGIDRLTHAEMLVGHYVEGFDIPVLIDLSGARFDSKKVVDTVTLSRRLCQLPNHKLETWGEMVGLPKLPKPRFDIWTPGMTVYCERDCHVTARAFDVLFDIQIERGYFEKGFEEILSRYAEAKLNTMPLSLVDMPY